MTLRSYFDGSLFVEHEHGDPPIVVALHGWGRTRADLAPLVAGHESLLPDLPGFGMSPPPSEVWGSQEYAALVARLLEIDGRGPYVVAAHSNGGRVAVRLAATRPELVAGVLFCGVPLVHLAPSHGPASIYRVARWANQRRLLSDTRMERLRQRYGSDDYRAAQGTMRGVLVRAVAEDFRDLLPDITAPVGFLWGARDTAVPVEVARVAAEACAHVSCFEVVDDAGHDVVRQAPDRARAALARVIADSCAS